MGMLTIELTECHEIVRRAEQSIVRSVPLGVLERRVAYYVAAWTTALFELTANCFARACTLLGRQRSMRENATSAQPEEARIDEGAN